MVYCLYLNRNMDVVALSQFCKENRCIQSRELMMLAQATPAFPPPSGSCFRAEERATRPVAEHLAQGEPK
jgi:hypothetical protein